MKKRLNVSSAAVSNCIVHYMSYLKKCVPILPRTNITYTKSILIKLSGSFVVFIYYIVIFLIFNSFKIVNIKAWELGREAQYIFNFIYSLIHLSLQIHLNALLMITQNTGPWLSSQATQNT